jgi:hypothetical protein
MLKNHRSRAYAASALTTLVAVTAVGPAFHAGDGVFCSLERQTMDTGPEKRPSAACTVLRPDVDDEPSDDRSQPRARQQQIALGSTIALSGRSSIAMTARARPWIIPDHPQVNMLPLTSTSPSA